MNRPDERSGAALSAGDPAPLVPSRMRDLVRERIGDARLRRNVRRATATSLDKRATVVRDYDDWEAMRTAAHTVKRHVVGNLGALLASFERHATEAGARVHFARDAAEARDIVLELVRAAGALLVVKSKSMTTEEIGLTHALEAAGVEAVETDLGEYIVQLAGEMPSHITAPALHKSREEIGALFAEKLGIAYTSEPVELTAVARETLRRFFLEATVGISGVNFALADSGTICVVENEGNARLSMTLPRTHIAVMGVEKILPDFRALSLFLSLLGRSATGQRITSYTSLIRGPRKEGETDGPEDLQIVVLDNGRTRMLAEPALRDALMCIRCGACMNVCPVYQKVGGHAYGSIYSGPIGAVITPVFAGMEEARTLPYASSLCGACAEICPVKIDLHHMLLWWRKSIAGARLGPPAERAAMRAFALMMRRAWRYDLAGRLARTFWPLLAHGGSAPVVPGWSATRDFPRLPAHSFKDLWKEHQRDRA
jgi:L-lactate dehydrogenase complex protein LldF